MRVDVAVIGLGAMGSAAAWRAASRGASVVAFEQFDPGHDQGSSHGETRIIRTAYYEGPQYVPLVQSAFGLWRELERESGAALLTMTGALMAGAPTSNLVSGALASARAHNLVHEMLDADEMRRRYPQLQLAPGEIAFYEQQAGILQPEEAIRTMVAQAIENGATVLRHTAVTSIEPDGRELLLQAGERTYHARHAIVAAGAWLPVLLPGWRLPLTVERQVFVWFPLRDPALFSYQRFPVFMHELTTDSFRYGIVSPDGATIKMGLHHEGIITTAATIDRAVHEADVAPVRDFVRERMPAVEPVVARSKVCMYTNTPDRHFLIGSPPDQPNITVLSVCSGHGFKYASVIGDAAADLALSGTTAYPIDLFTPQRFELAQRS